MGRAQALSYEDYIPYEGPRVAGFSPEQLGAQEGIKAIAQRGMPLMDEAGRIASYASQASPLMASSQYQAGPIQSQYGGSNIRSRFRGAPVRSTYGAEPIRSTYSAAPIYTGVTGAGPEAYASIGRKQFDAGQYMSPYLENVMDRQQRRAVQRFDEDQQRRSAQAIKSGAFGGSRQAVGDFLAQRELSERLGDIEAQQLEKGYQSARAQFEADRAAKFKALGMSDQQALALAKQRSAEQIATEDAKRQAASQNLQAQIAQMKGLSEADSRRLQAQIAEGKFGQAAGQMDLESQIARDKTLQAAQQYGLQAQIAQDKAMQQQGRMGLEAQLANQRALEAAYGRGLTGAGVLADLTKQEQALDLQRLKSLSDVGTQRQGMMQRAYDLAYEDFLKQREYPYEQLERYSGMLQGLPVQPSWTKQMYSPRPDPTAQLFQTGLGAYGMGRGMGMFG